jgi:hypothetical protein
MEKVWPYGETERPSQVVNYAHLLKAVFDISTQ